MVSLLQVTSAAVAAGMQRFIRDTALRDAPDFDHAWSLASNVPGYFSETNAAVFWGVMHDQRPRVVVEIGSYQGRSTGLIGLALQHASGPEARLTAIDPHTGDRQAMEALGSAALPSLELFRLHMAGVGLGDSLLEKVMPAVDAAVGWQVPVDLLFDDGWHSYDAVRADAAAWMPHLAPEGIVCFDDYEHYDEVRQAVDEVCAEYGLKFYGTVMAQAWAGRAPAPPPALCRALRAGRIRHVLRRIRLSSLPAKSGLSRP